ncbi:MAG: hypothetical protein P8Z37_06865 [Acidobacteriota bacterium]
MEKTWSYKDYQVQEGLKPGTQHFQYFYVIRDGDNKRCSYCVWIDDDALSEFDPSRKFEMIADLHSETWKTWVKENLDREDFRNLVLKHSREGKEEIDLDKEKETMSPD